MTTWMAEIDGERTIRSLSLPGTHGSAALHGGHIVQDQTLTLTQQLNGGIRLLDLRLRHIENVFALHHGLVFQEKFFGDALNEIQTFLRTYPTETVFVRVKEEYKPARNNRSFEATFQTYFDRYKSIIAVPENGMQTRLDDLRGKLVFLVDFKTSHNFGLGYDTFDIQDEFNVGTNWELYTKWERVKEQLALAKANPEQGPAIMNYLTGSGGALPYFVASGHVSAKTNANRLSTGRIARKGDQSTFADFPRVNCLPRRCTIAYEGTNTLTRDYIRRERPGYVGFVFADFPGPDLIKAIADVNDAPPRALTLASRATGGCLSGVGRKLQVLPCSTERDQDFTLESSTLRIGGFCVEAQPGRYPVQLELRDCNDAHTQKWTLKNGQIRLGPAANAYGVCLDVQAPVAGGVVGDACKTERDEQLFDAI
ncbi:phosphatidylinositol-specific phospholipase C domain-containing protein [Lysobacter sp. TAF61]|uniref:phosphatidylinositol-specific phospholipase C domain-containing protein n=1 Tax=Lysobacter sp. TAF61 TaxID=3233072 RepID=UPI003F999AFC